MKVPLTELMTPNEIKICKEMAIKLTKIMLKEKFTRAMCIGTAMAMEKVFKEESQRQFEKEWKQGKLKQ